MSYTLVTCPNCKSTNTVLIDNEPMDTHPNEKGVDSEIYATCKCGDCNNNFNVIGQISWKHA